MSQVRFWFPWYVLNIGIPLLFPPTYGIFQIWRPSVVSNSVFAIIPVSVRQFETTSWCTKKWNKPFQFLSTLFTVYKPQSDIYIFTYLHFTLNSFQFGDSILHINKPWRSNALGQLDSSLFYRCLICFADCRKASTRDIGDFTISKVDVC